jgi:protein-disulfide isomerase
MDMKKMLGAGAAGLLIGGGAVALAGQDGGLSADPGRARIEAVVREYILANPEIIPEAIDRLQSKTLTQAIDSNRAAYETPFGSAWAGAEKGDVILVEFFDYACGFCRQSNPAIERLLAEDKGLKVVWRDWPVLGPDSQEAASLSLAAAQQGKFGMFHNELFALGRPTPAALTEVRNKLAIAAPEASNAIRSELDSNRRLAAAINATGTPTFIVGDKVLQGAVGYDALKEAIAAARAQS